MKKIRAVGILIKNNKILLIHRIKEKEYFVFPGGKVEEGETIKEAVERELLEETSMKVKVNKLLYHHIYDDNSEQFFYLCDYIKGEPRLSDNSPEKTELEGVDEVFIPKWFDISTLNKMLLYPLEIRDLFLQDYKSGFMNPVNILKIKVSELRQTI